MAARITASLCTNSPLKMAHECGPLDQQFYEHFIRNGIEYQGNVARLWQMYKVSTSRKMAFLSCLPEQVLSAQPQLCRAGKGLHAGRSLCWDREEGGRPGDGEPHFGLHVLGGQADTQCALPMVPPGWSASNILHCLFEILNFKDYSIPRLLKALRIKFEQLL